MMSNNKILTVSYGTFSCTLEGFDDSFDTMKAIAEYFRDLAADDRYFGAEPPQPDAEMLARIAEREIARRVEAHLSEDGVHLRASAENEDDAAVDRTAPDTATGDAADSHAPVPQAAATEAPQAATPAAQAFGPSLLQASQSYTMVSMSALLPTSPVLDQPAETGLSMPQIAADDEASPDIAGPEDDAALFFAQRAEVARQDHPLAEDMPAPATRPAPNSIADKLQRIRAVVSKSHEPQADYSEDEHAEAILDEDETDSGLVADFFSHHADVELESAVATEQDEDAEPVMLVGQADASDAADVAEGSVQPDQAEAVEADEDDQGDIAGSEYDFSSLLADQDAAEADAVEDVATPPAVRARVIRVKRRDLEAALNAGLLEEAEAEADLEWDIAESLDGEEDPSDSDATAARLSDEVAVEEEELDRLMAQADSQLDEAESTSRRAAFDQMRGAVAAAKADDGLEAADPADEDAYRTDLAAAVTPRRPVAGGRTDRPRDQRPAPLKLVAEQRIDIPLARTGPVQPRRVAVPLAVPGEGDHSFSDYAATRGARDLPELLEAAAAYLSFVEGRDHFSRPQLMSKVRQIDSDGFSREEGLRQFGILLRSGKIEKVQGGRFTVSDDIGFRPDGERAAG